MARHHEQLYNTQRWRKRSVLQRQQFPMCQSCEAKGRLGIVAKHSHHIEPHNGDQFRFHYGKLMSLCHSCHELTHNRPPPCGYSKEIDASGWPVDPAHPVHQVRQ